jgi:hypothetical protein
VLRGSRGGAKRPEGAARRSRGGPEEVQRGYYLQPACYVEAVQGRSLFTRGHSLGRRTKRRRWRRAHCCGSKLLRGRGGGTANLLGCRRGGLTLDHLQHGRPGAFCTADVQPKVSVRLSKDGPALSAQQMYNRKFAFGKRRSERKV